MFYKGVLVSGLVAAILFSAGCSAVGFQAVYGLGKVMQTVGAGGIKAIAGAISGSGSAADIAPAIIGSKLDAMTKSSMQFEAQKGAMSPGVLGVGIVGGIVNEIGNEKRERENAEALGKVQEVFGQLNNGKVAAKEPDKIDFGNGSVVKPITETEAKVDSVLNIGVEPNTITEP